MAGSLGNALTRLIFGSSGVETGLRIPMLKRSSSWSMYNCCLSLIVQLPGLPDLPDLPGSSGFAGLPDFEGLPGFAGVPDFTGFPEFPDCCTSNPSSQVKRTFDSYCKL